jgi:mxaJ protein
MKMSRKKRHRIWILMVALGAGASTAAAQQVPKSVTALRVCADPNNLPFSNRAGEGFENRIASLLAQELKLPVQYTWHPQGQGFVRKTLNAGNCDVIIGVPEAYGPLSTSKPYYRSTYVMVYKADSRLDISSLDDLELRHVRIGVQLIGDDYHNTPPAQALAARGIIDNVKGFPIFANYALPNPEARIIDALVANQIDVAIVWGPLAGYFAARAPVSFKVIPLPSGPDASGAQFAFDIAMGVRRADGQLRSILDELLEKNRVSINRILEEYGVPMVHP